MTLALFANALVFSFIVCCIVSAALQILAWSRHARAGAPISLRALWQPEGHFDDVGLRQIRLARRLLTVGGLAYLTYGLLMLIAMVTGANG
jgi:hypothetical protein